ncbi:MAG: hypothetical protein RMK60_06600 [Burkholderiales bacterium]|nr:hypothetical protein [Burkholderiales bacterium]
MNTRRPMDFATLMWWHLPSVYREQDNPRPDVDTTPTAPGDLARLLGAYGDLLDALYRTLLQRYYDSFPETEGEDAEGLRRGCQPWVLPYIARLLDLRLRSPLERGQRLEVGRAVAWRQRKGTLGAIEDIASAVADVEMEVQEGWRRVALTPRVGFSLLPPAVFGLAPSDDGEFGRLDRAYDPRLPQRRARHPGMPGGAVDLRRVSRAVQGEPGSTAARRMRIQGRELWWAQANPHGVPCFPGSYQDASVRTADLRTPDGRRGHAHPRRVLLYLPPFTGFFTQRPVSIGWGAIRPAVLEGGRLPEGLPLVLEAPADDPGTRRLTGVGSMPVRIRGAVRLDAAIRWRFENLWFDNRLQIRNGRVELAGCAVRELRVHTADTSAPVVLAQGSLFKRLLAPRGLVRLLQVTVLERLVAEHLEASDCIFCTPPRKDLRDADVPAAGCVRYSRLPHLPMPPDPNDPHFPGPPDDPAWRSDGRRSALRTHRCTVKPVRFRVLDFGRPGCAVLHPDASPELRFGAEDGGELGAYHDLRYTLREQAVLDKLREHLPLGLHAVLVADATLSCLPPLRRPSPDRP